MAGKPFVLFTGATGHLGFRALVIALQDGYRARVAYRRAEQAEKVKKARSIQPFLTDIDFVHVPDITAPGAFDEAIQGVNYFVHIASPIYDTGESAEEVRDWQREFYDPAVKGSLTALDAALTTPTVRRVVITSSVVALSPPEGSTVAGPYDVGAIPPPETRNSFTRAAAAYTTSKIMAHRAVDDWVAAHPSIHFDVVRVLPGYIQGANELAGTVEAVGAGSNEGTINTALGNLSASPKPTVQVYLDDLARAHIVSLDSKFVASNAVLIAVANHGLGWSWDEFVPVIERLYPEEIRQGLLRPTKGQAVLPIAFDTTETYKILGYEFKGIEEMVKSLVGQYLKVKGQA